MVPGLRSRLAFATLVLALPGSAKRVDFEDLALSQQGVAAAACTANSCTSFDAETCSCVAFANTTDLKKRMESLLYELMQKLRFLSDKLDADSGVFRKLWYGPSLHRAQQELTMLQGALEYMPEVALITETPVKALGTVFTPPAGCWPILVEIWDENALLPNSFLGEVGVPLTEGRNEYTLPLRANPQQHDRVAQGTVTFVTTVSRSSPKPCSTSAMHCITISVHLSCLSAANLLQVDSGIGSDFTDPYCKVRIKQDGMTRSSKDKTAAVDNNLNPRFPLNEFTYTWEEPLIEPQPTNPLPDLTVPAESSFVPWVLEEMTPSEQAQANLYLLVSTVYSDPKKCAEGRGSKVLCDAVQALGRGRVDKTTLDEAAAELGDKEIAASAARAERLSQDLPDPKVVAGDDPHAPAKGVMLQLQAVEERGLVADPVIAARNFAAVQSQIRAGNRIDGWGGVWNPQDPYAALPPGRYVSEGTTGNFMGHQDYHHEIYVHNINGVPVSYGWEVGFTHRSPNGFDPAGFNMGGIRRPRKFSIPGAILGVVIVIIVLAVTL